MGAPATTKRWTRGVATAPCKGLSYARVIALQVTNGSEGYSCRRLALQWLLRQNDIEGVV